MTTADKRVRGERHYNSKLTEADARLILRLSDETDMSASQIAAKFDVSKSCIVKLLSGENWKHI